MQHRERQQDRDEGRQQLACRSAVPQVDVAGDADRRRRHQQADEQGAGVAHEQLRRVPVERQEADAGADQHRRDELRQVEVRRSARSGW